MRWSEKNRLYLPDVPSVEGIRNPSAAAAAVALPQPENITMHFDAQAIVGMVDNEAFTGTVTDEVGNVWTVNGPSVKYRTTALNGRPAFQSQADGSYFIISSAAGSTHFTGNNNSMAAVFNIVDSGATYLFGFGSGFTGRLLMRSSASVGMRYWTDNAGDVFFFIPGEQPDTMGAGNNHIFTAAMSASSGNVRLERDGTYNVTKSCTTTSGVRTADLTFLDFPGLTNSWDGAVGEWISWNVALTTDEQTQAYQSLAAKWGL